MKIGGSGDRFFGRDEYFNSVIVKSKKFKSMLKKVIITGGNQNTLFGEVLSKMKTTEFAA